MRGLQRLSRLYDRYRDLQLNIETCGLVTKSDLEISDSDRRFANGYEPIPYLLLEHIFRKMIPLPFRDFQFVDYGCGRGRALALAADAGFKTLRGVDIDPQSVAIAKSNLPDLEILCASAETMSLVAKPTLSFFFNPFYPEVLAPVLKNIKNIELIGHKQYVLFVNLPYRNLLQEMGLTPLQKFKVAFTPYEAELWEFKKNF